MKKDQKGFSQPKNYYQTNYSELHLNEVDYLKNRHIKAEKTLAVIKDVLSCSQRCQNLTALQLCWLSGSNSLNRIICRFLQIQYVSERDIIKDVCPPNLAQYTVLEIGCFTGEISRNLVGFFSHYIALDIDPGAIQIAATKSHPHNLKFLLMNAETLSFEDETFDIIICSHIYEHIPNPTAMMQEIYRTLKQGGRCYFAAANKLNPVDQEYGLLFATLLPKKMANYYMRTFRGIPEYYETFLTLSALRKLVRPFKVLDYTKVVISNPNRFQATDMIAEGSLKQKLVLFILEYFYWLSPTYIWILEK